MTVSLKVVCIDNLLLCALRFLHAKDVRRSTMVHMGFIKPVLSNYSLNFGIGGIYITLDGLFSYLHANTHIFFCISYSYG